MKKVQILLSLCLAWSAGISQTHKVDSLIHELQAKPDTNRVEVLWGIAYELFDVNNAEALFYAARAYQEVWKGGDSLQIVKVGTIYGQLLRRMDQIDRSIEVSTLLLPIAKRHDYRKYTKMLLNSLGLSHTMIEQFDEALDYSYQSLNQRVLEGNRRDISHALGNIGLMYYKLGDFESAIDYTSQSIKMDKNSNDQSGLSLSYGNMGQFYVELKEPLKALNYFDTAMVTIKVSYTPVLAAINYGIANAYLLLNNLDSAKSRSLTSLYFAESSKEQWFQIFNLLLLAELSLKQDLIHTCNDYLERVEMLPAFGKYPLAQLNTYKLRADYFTRIGQFEKASHYYKQHFDLYETTYTDGLHKRIRAIQIQISQKENLTKIKSQSEILKLKDEAINRQAWLIGMCIAVLVLTICMIVVLYRSNSRKKRITRILDQRVRERTIELGRQRDELQHAYDEQSISRNKVSSEIIGLVATLRGLFYLSEKELLNGRSTYFKQAEVTTDKIVSVIGQYKANYRLHSNRKALPG